MECDHYGCYLEAKWVITPRDDKGKLLPKRKRTFCSFCMMRVINRDGYHTAVIEKLEDEGAETLGKLQDCLPQSRG